MASKRLSFGKSGPEGFVLIYGLLFISLLMLLISLMVECLNTSVFLSASQYIHAQHTEALFEALKLSYRQVSVGQMACTDNLDSGLDILAKPSSWWMSGIPCQGESGRRRFQYVLKPLEDNPCQTLDGKYGVQFWLTILRVEPEGSHDAPLWARMFLVVPKDLKVHCDHEPVRLFSSIVGLDVI